MHCAACALILPHDRDPGAPCDVCGGDVRLDGRYVIVAALGRGAAAITWHLRDRDGAAFAGKELLLRADLAAKARELAHREARVLAEISHPQIPRLRETLVTGHGRSRSLWIIQDLVPGQDLASVLASRRLSVREVGEIVASALAPLAYLHGLSPPVVHRDLKPGNLILRPDGQVALVDFGAVRDAVADTTFGGSTVAGTFGYMAPEQFAGDAWPASDLYGLGATAVHLLTRAPPHRISPGPAWRRGLHLDPRFAALIDAMRDPDPARRPPAAAAQVRIYAWLAAEPGPRPANPRLPDPRPANPRLPDARPADPRLPDARPADPHLADARPADLLLFDAAPPAGPRVAEVRRQVWALRDIGHQDAEADVLAPTPARAVPAPYAWRGVLHVAGRALVPSHPGVGWARAAWAAALLLGLAAAVLDGARDPQVTAAWSAAAASVGERISPWTADPPRPGPWGAEARSSAYAVLERLASRGPLGNATEASRARSVAERARHVAPAAAISMLEDHLATASDPEPELARAIVLLSGSTGPPIGADASRILRWAGLAVMTSSGAARADLYGLWVEAYLHACPAAPAVVPDGPCGRAGAELRDAWALVPAAEDSFPWDRARCERVLPSDACRP